MINRALIVVLLIAAGFAGGSMNAWAEQVLNLERATASVYGYVKMDAVWNDSEMYPGNYAAYVMAEDVNANRDEFQITARETRLGAKVVGGGTESMSAGGTVEWDFYGGTSENKSNVMLRHAFMELAWPESQISIIAGQTWDVMGPLNPSVLNYSVMWCAGNVGYRRPQIRVTKAVAFSGQRIDLAVAAARTIVESGLLNPGFPTGQARVGYSFPLPGDRKAAIGVSGHYGEFQGDPGNGALNSFDTWSVVGDLSVILVGAVCLKGEVWTGENLEAYQGAVGQGIKNAASKCIGATGGWAMIDSGMLGKWNVGVGASLDDPRNGNLAADGKSRNGSVFGKLTYALSQAATCGIEVSHWDTQYKDGSKDAKAARVQGSMIYRF